MAKAYPHIVLPSLVILCATLLAALGVIDGHETTYIYLGSLGVSSHGVGYVMGKKASESSGP